jgi:hypothetical protein
MPAQQQPGTAGASLETNDHQKLTDAARRFKMDLPGA